MRRLTFAIIIAAAAFSTDAKAEIKTTNDCIDRGGGVHDAFACASRQACKINGKIICLESETPSTVSPGQGGVKKPDVAQPKAPVPDRAQ
jgi:hypothetical protein